MQQVIPFMWFDGQAEEAAEFYTEIFKSAAPSREGGGFTFEVGGIKVNAFNACGAGHVADEEARRSGARSGGRGRIGRHADGS